MVTDSKDSMLAAISSVIVPVFKPLGLGDWRICTSLISGLMAKESVVSEHSRQWFGGTVTTALTTLSAASLLVFSLTADALAADGIHKKSWVQSGQSAWCFCTVCDCMGGSIYCKSYWTACDVIKNRRFRTTENQKDDVSCLHVSNRFSCSQGGSEIVTKI